MLKGPFLSPCLLKGSSPIRHGPGDTDPSLLQPKGRVVAGLQSREGVRRRPRLPCWASLEQQPPKKSHWQSWFQGKHSEMPKLAPSRANTSPWVSGVVPGVFPTPTPPRTPRLCSRATHVARPRALGWAPETGQCPAAVSAGYFNGTKGNNTRSRSFLQPAPAPRPCFSQLHGSRVQQQPKKTMKGKNKYCETRGCRNQLQLPIATSGHHGMAQAGPARRSGRAGRGSVSPACPVCWGQEEDAALGSPWQEPCGPRSIAVPLLGNLISLLTE